MPKRRLSRAKHNVIARLNRRLDHICTLTQIAVMDAYAASSTPDDSHIDIARYESIAVPLGRKLYADTETIDIKRKLKALGVKGINL
jgi:hypothetical protein